MDFLSDKKNQPIIIGAVVVLILGVGALYYFMLRPKKPAPSTVDYSQTTPMPADTVASMEPGAGGAVAPTVAPTGVAPTATSPAGGMTSPGVEPGVPAQPGAQPAPPPKRERQNPAEKADADPFRLPFRAPVVPIVRPPEPIPYPTWRIVPRKRAVGPEIDTQQVQQLDQTPRRMAGLLYNGSVSAILETGTDTVVVKPGDLVENRTMRVERIEPDRIVLKSVGGQKSRYVEVKMAGSQGMTGVASASAAPVTPGIAPPSASGGVYRTPAGVMLRPRGPD